MRTIRIIFCFMLLGPVIPATAASFDTLPLQERLIRSSSPSDRLTGELLRNPAAVWFSQDYSLTRLSLGYDGENRGHASLQQLGDGYEGFAFRADTYVVMDTLGKAYGSAGYQNGRKKNIRWSETSDVLLLYPYLTADSVGGDMTSETYCFSGGYTHRLGKWTLGGYLDYRATLEYRTRDPRPRNVISDLQASLGATRSVGSSYRLGMAAHGRKYSQNGSIDFYNDYNSVPVFHLTGLGMDYTRFTGLQTSTLYDGYGAGGEVSLFSAGRNGFSARAGYDYFTFTKKMRSLNNLPLTELDEHTVSGLVSWNGRGKRFHYGVTAQGNYRKRTGRENVFGEAAGGVYPQISSNEQYNNRIIEGSVKGFVGNDPSAATVWWAEPEAGWTNFEALYPSAGREMSFSRWHAGAGASVMRPMGGWLVRLSGNVFYSAGMGGTLNLSGAEAGRSRTIMLQENYRYLTDNALSAGLSAQVNHGLSRDWSIFLRAACQYSHFAACGNATEWSVSVGFAF